MSLPSDPRPTARRVNALRLPLRALLALFIALAPAARTLADDSSQLESFLQSHHLQSLLALHLEDQFNRATDPQVRQSLLRQLSDIYSSLLESTTDPDLRQNLRDRSKKILAAAASSSPAATRELRLSLLRGDFRSAEAIAENHRLGLASPEDLQSALTSLSVLIPQLQELRSQFKDDLDNLDRRLSRASGVDSLEILSDVSRVKTFYEQASFITAWSLYYQSWLNNRSDNAKIAEPIFAELLGTESPSPAPSEVSVDLRSSEPIARCILGMALCKSLTSGTVVAITWINLLDHEKTFPALRQQMPAWKLAIFLEHQEFTNSLDLLQTIEKSGTQIPAPWLRLAAVYALRNNGKDRAASDLASFAVTQLASREDLQQLLDLAEKFGVESLSTKEGGFAVRYVAGVLQYHRAREQHNSQQPTLDPKLIDLYNSAASALTDALKQTDAKTFATTHGACQRLIAWCRYFQSRYIDAAQAFEKAADLLPESERPDALWMAIVCTDQLVQNSTDSALRAKLAKLTDTFLDRYPYDQHAGRLILQRVASSKSVSMSEVERLLAVPASSDVYASAHRTASQMLCQLFRDAAPTQRAQLGKKFLTVATPLLATPATDSASSSDAVLLSRQTLEIALDPEVSDLPAARSALQRLDDLSASRLADLASYSDELDYRRMQERLLSNDSFKAAQFADALWSRNESSTWSRASARTMFRWAHDRWKDPQSAPSDAARALDLTVRYGGRVLREYAASADPLSDPAALAYHAAVAEASLALFKTQGDLETGRAALFLYQQLLRRKPNSGTFLRAAAILSESLNLTDEASNYWKTISNAAPAASDLWYESKTHLIQILARTDPARARLILDQHIQLYPEYGPAPWGSILKGLDQQLPKATPSA